MATQKIKATEITLSGMTGLTIRQITFHDYEQKIFVIGRERSKRQYKNLDKVMLIEGHLDVERLDDARYKKTDDHGFSCKQRCFPPSKADLERDLKVLEEIEQSKKLHDCNIKEMILKEIEKAKDL